MSKNYASKQDIRNEIKKTREMGKPTEKLHMLVYNIAVNYVPKLLPNQDSITIDEYISYTYLTALMKYDRFILDGLITEDEINALLKAFISPVIIMDDEEFEILNTHFKNSWYNQINGKAFKKKKGKIVKVWHINFKELLFNNDTEENIQKVIDIANGKKDINELYDIWSNHLLKGKKSLHKVEIPKVTNNYFGTSPFSYFTQMVKNNVFMKIKKDKTYKNFNSKIFMTTDNIIVERVKEEADYDIENKVLRVVKNNKY